MSSLSYLLERYEREKAEQEDIEKRLAELTEVWKSKRDTSFEESHAVFEEIQALEKKRDQEMYVVNARARAVANELLKGKKAEEKKSEETN